MIAEILAYISVGLITISWLFVVLLSLITKAREKVARKKAITTTTTTDNDDGGGKND